MKKLFAIIAGLLLTAGIVSAQEPKAKKVDAEKNKAAQTAKKETCDKKNCCMMKDGKMIVMKDGKEMPMESDVTLANGTVIKKDGSMTMKDGKTAMMKNDDCIDMSGNASKMMKHHHAKTAKPATK